MASFHNTEHRQHYYTDVPQGTPLMGFRRKADKGAHCKGGATLNR